MVAQHLTESVDQIASTLSTKGIQVSKTKLRRKFKEAGVQSMRSTFNLLLASNYIKNKDLNRLLNIKMLT